MRDRGVEGQTQMLKLVFTPPAQHRLRHLQGGVCDDVQTHHDALHQIQSDTWSEYLHQPLNQILLNLFPPNPHNSSHVSVRPLRSARKQPQLVPVLAVALEQPGGWRGCHPGDPQTGWAGSTRSHITRVLKKTCLLGCKCLWAPGRRSESGDFSK